MKKTLITAAALLLTIVAGAQNMFDAATFAQTNYYGTARSMGLANAVTALGGDLGTIGINPAGGAVAGYSQFTITPALTISQVGAGYAPDGYSSFDAMDFSRHNKFTMPNCGFNFRYDAEPGQSLKAFNCGFVVNSTNNYLSDAFGRGTTSRSSKFAEMAAVATGRGFDPTVASYNNGAYSDIWDVIMGSDIGLFNSFGTNNEYVGCTEALTTEGHSIPGNLIQKTNIFQKGYKTDMIFNFGFNFNDNFFLGFNMGVPVGNYVNNETYAEVAQDPDLFPVNFTSGSITESTNFSDATYQHYYSAEMSGIYAKVGFIWLPTGWLRIGGAIQTPTAYTIEEVWQHYGSVNYDMAKYSASGHSEEGNYRYDFRSPWSANFGIAITLGALCLVSVDYEMQDYSVMRYSEYDPEYDTGYFDYTNEVMKNFYGVQHNLRVGAEINLTRQLAARGGFGYTTSPEKYYTNGATVVYGGDYDDDYYLGRKALPSTWAYNSDMMKYCVLGLGYKSRGSFFADFAFKVTSYPSYTYQPYYDYYTYAPDSNGDLQIIGDNTASRLSVKRYLSCAALTFGWRF